jgi:hypothetical protein
MKCGGTTLRHLLADEYPHDDILPVAVDPRSTATPPYPHIKQDEITHMLSLRSADVAGYRLIMSHYDWRIMRILDDDWQIMTMLRHPVRQLMSRYYFIDRARDLYGDEWERTGGDFRRWLLNHAASYANAQTRALGGTVARAAATLADDRVVFGLVEQFPESIDLFNSAFGWHLPHPPRFNRASINTDEIDLDDETYQLAASVQSDDMALYAIARARFAG